jgi:tetratricopeptide (TPR) repeat protein
MKRRLLICWLLLVGSPVFAQRRESQNLSDSLTRKAVKFIDANKATEALTLLAAARKADPESFFPVYETGYVHYAQKEYKRAIAVLELVLDHENVEDQAYQLVGNSWDNLGKPKKALAAYEAGLKKFPKSGKLYLETGTLYAIQKEYDKALQFYEKGIKAEPDLASNYYRAALIYASSSEKIWNVLYGELFMNLERNTPRTVEMGKEMFETYKKSVTIENDTAYSVHFSKRANVMYAGDAAPKLPFSAIYEITFATSLAGEKVLDLPALVRTRMRFTDLYFKNNLQDQYPNVLFNYQGEIKEAGHLEAYNYWLLGDGDVPAFKKWLADHKEDYAAFADWYNEHPLELNEFNSFRSGNF